MVGRRRAEHVRYVHNPTRLGFHGNFAQLFSRAKGRYIEFLNDDDVLHVDCVAKMVGAFVELRDLSTALLADRLPGAGCVGEA